jgi:hypothetical protein
MLITNNSGEKMQFNTFDGVITYINPFGLTSGVSKPDFKRVDPLVCSVDGGMIIQVYNNQFDYLVNGEVVTQRAGASLNLLKIMVAEGLKPLDYEHQFKIQQISKG